MIQLLAALIFLTVCNPVLAKEFKKVPELACPETIEVETDQRLNSTPKGWRKFFDKTNFHPRLRQINFYGDAPESLVHLKPDDNGVVLVGANYWITCVYAQTSVELTRKIPGKFSECRPVFEESIPTSVECR